MNPTATDKANTLKRTSTDPAMTTTHPTRSYLSYAPKSSLRRYGYSHFFDRVGFKPAHESEQMRTAFIVDMRTHVDYSSHKFLRRNANPEAFKIVVSEFLAEYGLIYWGDSNRDHLQEPDALKGFLCPRDAQREGSRLFKVVEAFFNHKAYGKIAADARKPMANRAIRHIDFAALTGRKVDVIGSARAIESRNFNKRSAALHESENEGVDNGEVLNVFERTKSPKRPRLLPDSEQSTQQTQTLDNDLTETYGETASREPLLAQLRDSSNRRFASLTASVNLEKDPKRARPSHMSRKEEPSPETEDLGSFKTLHPHGLTPPLTSTLEPNRSSESLSILSDDPDTGEEQQRKKPTTTSHRTSTEKDKMSVTKVARGFEDVKIEPLTDDMMKKTMFLVTVHDSPIGPMPIPFTECGSFPVLFPILIEERGVLDEDTRKIDNITTIFTWTSGEFGGRVGGIRRNKPGD